MFLLDAQIEAGTLVTNADLEPAVFVLLNASLGAVPVSVFLAEADLDAAAVIVAVVSVIIVAVGGLRGADRGIREFLHAHPIIVVVVIVRREGSGGRHEDGASNRGSDRQSHRPQ